MVKHRILQSHFNTARVNRGGYAAALGGGIASSGGVVFESETSAWATAVGVAGGTASAGTKTAVNNFVVAAKAHGYFSKFLRLNLLCGDFAAATVPLVKTVGATVDTFNSFVSGDYAETGASGGLNGNSSKWIDPGANANAGSLTVASCHLSYYATRASATGTDSPIGRDVNGTDAFSIYTYGASSPRQVQTLIGSAVGTSKIASGLGLSLASVVSSAGDFYVAGQRRYVTSDSVAGNIPSSSQAVFSHNAGQHAWDGRMNAYSWGTGMTRAEAAFYAADMEAFQVALSRSAVVGTSISCWGDSLTFGSTASNSYPLHLITSYGDREVFNGGVHGENCAQVLARMQADPANCAGVVVIYIGYNDIGILTRAQIVAKTVEMVNALTTTKFVILSIPNGEVPAQYNTGGLYGDIVGTFTDLVALYPNNTLDMRAHLVSLHNGVGQDLVDFGHDIVPVSLRNDEIHLNNTGNTAVGTRLKTFIDGKGW